MYEVVIKNLNWDDAEFYVTFLKEEFEDDIDLEVVSRQSANTFLADATDIHEDLNDEEKKKAEQDFMKYLDYVFDEEGCKDCPDHGECYGEPNLLEDEEKEEIKSTNTNDNDKHYMSADDFKVLLGLLESFVH